MAMSVVLKAAPQSLVKSCRRLSQAVVIPPPPCIPSKLLYKLRLQPVSWSSHQINLLCRTLAAMHSWVCPAQSQASHRQFCGQDTMCRSPTPPHRTCTGTTMYSHPTVYTINHTLPCAALASHPTQCKNPCSGCANAGCKLSHEWREFPRFARKLEAI